MDISSYLSRIYKCVYLARGVGGEGFVTGVEVALMFS